MKTVGLAHPHLTELLGPILRRGGQLALRVHGSSMAPAIRAGDSIRVGSLTEREPRVGQVVVGRLGRGLLAHRVVAITAQGLLVRGDARGAPAYTIPREAVMAVVRAIEPLPFPQRCLRRATLLLAAFRRRLPGGDGRCR